jgi:hypothetical protein
LYFKISVWARDRPSDNEKEQQARSFLCDYAFLHPTLFPFLDIRLKRPKPDSASLGRCIMRPGLLAIGIILLVLGALGYFLPDADTTTSVETTSDRDTVQARSVDTETYATLDTGIDDDTDTDDNMNETNSTETTSDRTSMTTTSTTTTDVYETTADNGVPVAYVYLDSQGNMYNEDGEFMGTGLGSADMTTTVADRYGTSGTADTTYTGTSAYETTTDRTGTYAGNTSNQTGQAGTYARTDVYGTETTADTSGDTLADSTQRAGVIDDDTETTAVTTTGNGWLRTLSILAMVIGALLTILGLVLPNREEVAVHDRHTRTHDAAGRRVYEREEVHHRK